MECWTIGMMAMRWDGLIRGLQPGSNISGFQALYISAFEVSIAIVKRAILDLSSARGLYERDQGSAIPGSFHRIEGRLGPSPRVHLG